MTRDQMDVEYGPFLSQIETWGYDAAGNVVEAMDITGATTTLEYDHLHRLIEVTLEDPDGGGGQAAPVYAYQYDANGNRTRETNPLGAYTQFAFDKLNRLTTVTLADPDGGGGLTSPVYSQGHEAVMAKKCRENTPAHYPQNPGLASKSLIGI